MAAIERETKLTLDPEDYRRILASGPETVCTDQLNVYLHHPNRVVEGRGHFRARFETGRPAVATLKIPVKWVGDVREMIEVEAPLSEMGPDLFPWPKRWVDLATNVPDEFLRHFRAMWIARVRRLGWMRNRRCRMNLKGLGEIEVDRTTLPGWEVIYEVEVEEPDADLHQALVSEVMRMAPTATASRIGKFTRFLSLSSRLSSGSSFPGTPRSTPNPHGTTPESRR